MTWSQAWNVWRVADDGHVALDQTSLPTEAVEASACHHVTSNQQRAVLLDVWGLQPPVNGVRNLRRTPDLSSVVKHKVNFEELWQQRCELFEMEAHFGSGLEGNYWVQDHGSWRYLFQKIGFRIRFGKVMRLRLVSGYDSIRFDSIRFKATKRIR